jgi:hypothetical protein
MSSVVTGSLPYEGGRLPFVQWTEALGLCSLLPGAALLLTYQWWCARSDVRERRLHVDEAELTGKWTRSRPRPAASPEALEQPGGRWRRVIRALAAELKDEPDQVSDPEAFVDVPWVRLGPQMLEVGSRPLFEQLGSGVRYRVYLSAHARQLVAIESAEGPPRGYRDGPREHAAPNPRF